MIQKLPKEIQHEIYDRLEIEDRGNLNIAMPKNAIRKTLRTDIVKDSKLRVVSYYMKKVRGERKYYNNMTRFILENATDPTCKKLIGELETESGDGDALFSPRMVHAFFNNDTAYIKSLKNSGVMEDIDLQIIAHEGFKHVTSEFLRACEENSVAQNVLLNIFSTSWNKYIIVFSLVYFGNEDAVKYLMERKGVYDLYESWVFVANINVAVLFITEVSLKLLFKYFCVEDKVKSYMLDIAFQGMNMQVIKALGDAGVTLKDAGVTLQNTIEY